MDYLLAIIILIFLLVAQIELWRIERLLETLTSADELAKRLKASNDQLENAIKPKQED